eukprot:TRINITY_DN1404_c0_g2_i2.p1 TRINITY_DN1404_c0_g2~~TRINITY_DN1404_c0_g2_i2.p1  ORF type:complete len:320 (-),score=51.01 TRINITY_DN1404_c0_g2_i2:23-982(-)
MIKLNSVFVGLLFFLNVTFIMNEELKWKWTSSFLPYYEGQGYYNSLPEHVHENVFLQLDSILDDNNDNSAPLLRDIALIKNNTHFMEEIYESLDNLKNLTNDVFSDIVIYKNKDLDIKIVEADDTIELIYRAFYRDEFDQWVIFDTVNSTKINLHYDGINPNFKKKLIGLHTHKFHKIEFKSDNLFVEDGLHSISKNTDIAIYLLILDVKKDFYTDPNPIDPDFKYCLSCYVFAFWDVLICLFIVFSVVPSCCIARHMRYKKKLRKQRDMLIQILIQEMLKENSFEDNKFTDPKLEPHSHNNNPNSKKKKKKKKRRGRK